MDAAAGSARADYGGYGKFWNLPLPTLRHFELYGTVMMRAAGAPPSPTSPAEFRCHPSAAAGRPDQSGGTSAANAGLVFGLRGKYPFDGTQFPPLPWGGSRVSEPDIQLIEMWIAAGCPAAEEDGAVAGAAISDTQRRALATGGAPHSAFGGPVNQFAHDAGTLKARKNINFLTAEELRRLRAAVKQMKLLDGFAQDDRSFAYWARIHANQCQHGWEEFLTWHRAYLYGFEKQLQDIDPTVTLPYWDWSADSVNVQTSIDEMGSGVAKDNGYVPVPLQCWIDEDGLKTLTDGGAVSAETLAGLRRILDQQYSSGARLFAAAGITFGTDSKSDAAIIAILGDINPLWHWRRWPGGNRDLIFEAYPTPDDVTRIANFFTFGSGPMADQFFGALETIHNLIHNYSGGLSPYPVGPNNEFISGDMVDPGRTAQDPIFWAHHSNVDRLWADWQNRFPNGGPDNPSATLPPWNFEVSDVASISRLGYEYMMSSHVFPTDSQTPIQRFVSATTAVHPAVVARHRSAQIRLHVTRPGFHIRVFLNQSDATIDTPTRGNPHFVGQVSTFTGECVGGPGHCDAPVRRFDRFDLRPRPHKTPSSFRLDATATVKALALDDPSLQVNLLVLNHDGTPASDELRMDAVSLSFFD
jgi:tyrosinase